MDKQLIHNKDSRSTSVLEKYTSYYFVGIGGIGMSALARYFRHLNRHVMGYDRVSTSLTVALSKLEIDITYTDAIDTIDFSIIDKAHTLIIYTPAIPKENQLLQFFKGHGYTCLKRAEVLGIITRNTVCFAVAGTHGKTTTSTILGHLLYQCNVSMTAFLGGISKNYNSNFIYNGHDITVVEADEYDRSFLSLSPDYACITSMDADHLDIYGEREALEESFKSFSEKLKPGGTLFVRNGLALSGITYGLEDGSDYCAVNISIKNGAYHFDLRTPETTYNNFKFSLPGRHNLSNAVIALAMTVEYGCPPEQLVKALATFEGVERRFNYHLKQEHLVYIDDYAHHPTEIEAVYHAISEMYPTMKSIVIFQPHLFSRTKDFGDEFAKVLSLFDTVVLLDIYPAREEPIHGITSKWLLDKIDNSNKHLLSKVEMLSFLQHTDAGLILSLGAGDIGEEVQNIKNALCP